MAAPEGRTNRSRDANPRMMPKWHRDEGEKTLSIESQISGAKPTRPWPAEWIERSQIGHRQMTWIESLAEPW
jgi:hypothetical protein